MIVYPNAKINLGLNVTGIRTDGYHNIESVFFPVAFRDILEIIPSVDNTVALQLSGLMIPGKVEDNLCLRAYLLLKEEFHLPAVKMHLHKLIPMGAGLGGGSSDAAYTLKLLNDIFVLGLTASDMIEYAIRLGSDCAFFIRNETAFASGKGDDLQSINLDLAGNTICIVIPPVHVDTSEAYKNIKTKVPQERILSIVNESPGEWKGRLVNDFEDYVNQLHPEICQIKKTLYDAGATFASMSGSGSAVFGLFEKGHPVITSFSGCITWTGKI